MALDYFFSTLQKIVTLVTSRYESFVKLRTRQIEKKQFVKIFCIKTFDTFNANWLYRVKTANRARSNTAQCTAVLVLFVKSYENERPKI